MKVDHFTGQRPCVLKGLAAGALGGLLGSAAKAVAEELYPPRTEGQPAPPAVLAQRVAERSLNRSEKESAKQWIHYTFGTLTGAAYGAAAEYLPLITAGAGSAFAAALLLGTHESTLPALGLSAPPSKQVPREHTSEAATHLVYGVTTELVRRFARGRF